MAELLALLLKHRRHFTTEQRESARRQHVLELDVAVTPERLDLSRREVERLAEFID